MALEAGDKAPDFTIGNGQNLSDLGKYAIVYFYPKDDTTGCTIEAKEFTASQAEIRRTGAEVFGISTDDQASHDAFCNKYGLTIDLIPDPDKSISKAYDVLGEKGYANRVTFLVNGDMYIEKVWEQVNPTGHASELIDALRDRG